MGNATLDLLETWLSFRELSMADIQARFGISQKHIAHDACYLGLTGLTSMSNPDAYPGTFYFSGKEFALFYVEDLSEELGQLDPQVLEEHLGEPRAVLRSRAGKQHNHYVYPKKGIAFSADSQGISYLEIFEPTSLKRYKKHMYLKPAPFTR
jgi:hypothetical protein